MKSHRINISESEFIELLKNQDQRASSMLYNNYSAAVYGAILKIVSNEDFAADVMQEAFIKIWKNISLYNSTKGKLFTWILNVARNNALDIPANIIIGKKTLICQTLSFW